MNISEFSDSFILYSTQSRTNSDVGYNANCHGYTMTGEHTAISGWKKLIKYSENMSDKKILVYTYKHNISHSGRIVGKSFLHYIKRIGIVSTPLEIALQLRTEFKDGVFILPLEREQFFLHMQKKKLLTGTGSIGKDCCF